MVSRTSNQQYYNHKLPTQSATQMTYQDCFLWLI